ncbi:MAG: hypothetical protein U0Q11_22630 [Vicinamibacterales bacterium]
MPGYVNVLYSLVVSAVFSFVPALAYYVEPAPAAADSQTINKTLAWPGGQSHVLELSNINGSVHIVAENRSDVSIVATRTVDREGRNGQPTPTVDFRQESGRLLVCGDNTHCGCRTSRSDRRDDWDNDDRGREEDRARVRVDFEVRVPRAVTLNVCTVNSRMLRVEDTEGPFTISNVNGGLELVNLRGAGSAHTVNGSLQASFAAQPTGPSDFRTVNGRVDVTFPPSLSANLRLNTLHGGLYTDFETTLLPRTPPTPERRNGGVKYRFDRDAKVQVGAGGPELSFQTVNGDIRVRKPQ